MVRGWIEWPNGNFSRCFSLVLAQRKAIQVGLVSGSAEHPTRYWCSDDVSFTALIACGFL